MNENGVNCSADTMEDIKRIVLDLDMGTDDYLALVILLYAEKIGKIKIVAIICTNGNTTVDNVIRNVLRLLEITNRTDIPVYRGAEQPLLGPKKSPSLFHGSDGFGDLVHDCEPDISLVKNVLGAVALYDIISKNPGEISVMCIGPLTTLALTIKLFNDVTNKIKDVWIMGGNHMAVGNATSSAEFNFYIDPESVHIVLECLECPIVILPWECCVKSTITFEWRFNTLGGGNPALDLLQRAEEKIYQGSKFDYYLPCDAFVSFCFLNPKLYIKKQSTHHATIELHSYYTRGQVVLDHLKMKDPNVTIIEEIDQSSFMDMLLDIKNNF